MISIKNKTGNDYFTQWDTKQILVVTGELSDPVLHCRVDDTRAMVLPIKDGECTLDDTLLQKRGVLDVWVYDEHRTKRSAQFRVLPKPKPDDYVATPSAAKTWEDLDERVTALEKGGGGSSSADHDALVANTAARHTHDNKSVLDGIDLGDISKWNQSLLAIQTGRTSYAVGNEINFTGVLTYGGKKVATQDEIKALGITSATVGQLARIKTVDEDGSPTAWEAVDMPSGGSGETWTLHKKIKTTEIVSAIEVTLPDNVTDIILRAYQEDDGALFMVAADGTATQNTHNLIVSFGSANDRANTVALVSFPAGGTNYRGAISKIAIFDRTNKLFVAESFQYARRDTGNFETFTPKPHARRDGDGATPDLEKLTIVFDDNGAYFGVGTIVEVWTR